jgi:hypothetical protein
VTAPRPSGKAEQDDARRALAELSVPTASMSVAANKIIVARFFNDFSFQGEVHPTHLSSRCPRLSLLVCLRT